MLARPEGDKTATNPERTGAATPAVLILDAFSDFSPGCSEARVIKALLNDLFMVSTSEVVEIKSGLDILQVALNLGGYKAIYLSAHANQEGFGVSSGLVTKWATCGQWLQQYPSIEWLFLSGCEAGSFNTAKAIAQNCSTVKGIFGPSVKLNINQASLAAHVLFYHMFSNRTEPAFAAMFATIASGVSYTFWNCDLFR